MVSFLSFATRGLAIATAALAAASCALFASLPEPQDVAERLEAFPTRGLPLEGRVTIHWSERQVPFIEAESDGDAAFALGLVHAHLRLGQMATAHMLARGRVSEMIGPLGVDIDHGLRTLAYPYAAAEIEQQMDAAALLWVQRFVDGINHYQDTAAELPHDFDVLGLSPSPGQWRTWSPSAASPAPTRTGWSGPTCSRSAHGATGPSSGRVWSRKVDGERARFPVPPVIGEHLVGDRLESDIRR